MRLSYKSDTERRQKLEILMNRKLLSLKLTLEQMHKIKMKMHHSFLGNLNLRSRVKASLTNSLTNILDLRKFRIKISLREVFLGTIQLSLTDHRLSSLMEESIRVIISGIIFLSKSSTGEELLTTLKTRTVSPLYSMVSIQQISCRVRLLIAISQLRSQDWQKMPLKRLIYSLERESETISLYRK